MTVQAQQRHRRDRPCKVCGGYEEAPREHGVRCFGFASDDGRFEHCTREELAAGLEPNGNSGTYAHRLEGVCPCGSRHNSPAVRAKDVGTATVITDHSFEVPLPSGGTVTHRRLDRADGTKQMWWESDGVRGLLGLRLQELPLYGADRLREVPKGSTVIVTEGELKADELSRRGFIAVGTVTGARTTPSRASLEPLRGYDIVLWPDNDADGRGHMNGLAARAHDMGMASRCLEWSDAPAKGDAADFFRLGGTIEHLRELLAVAPPWTSRPDTPGTAPLADVVDDTSLRTRTWKEIVAATDDTPPRELVRGLLFEGDVVMIHGYTGLGKSLLLILIAVCISRERPFLGQFATARARVGIIDEETGALPRLGQRLAQIARGLGLDDG